MNSPLLLPFEQKYTSHIYEIYRPHVEQGNASFETQMVSADDFAKRLQKIADRYPFLLMVSGEELLGYCYASVHREREAYRWITETSIYMAPKAQGRGLGIALYEALFEVLKKRNFHYALAGITQPNHASVKLHHKAGFEDLVIYPSVGYKNGQWHSVLWMKKLLNEFNEQPPEPLFNRMLAAEVPEFNKR